MITPDSQPGAIRFGVLYGGAALENWQIRCLEQLAVLPDVHAEVSIAPARNRVPLGGAWAALPNIPLVLTEQSTVLAERACAVGCLTPAAIVQLRDRELDFILCFIDGVLPAGIFDLPRFGVWRYHLGDWVNYRGMPESFWEVYEHCAASAALLVRVHPDPDVVVVLREGFLRTNVLSVRKNREQLLARFAHWPAQVCRDISLRGSEEAFAKLELRKSATVRLPPTLWQRGWLFVRIALRMARTGFRSLFRHDQWNIGIVDRPIEQFLNMNGPPPIQWLPATRRSELRADPFGTLYQGRQTILCEHFSYRDNLGHIVAIDLEGDSASERVQIGPEQPVHLSYPFLFETGGRLLCVPESSAAKEIVLYELERFPDRWVKAATLISGVGFADATLFQYEGRWWLSASDVAEKGANSELHLWFAAAPNGPWTAHPGNPVKIDVRAARPAGVPFWVDGVLYRPAQDCSSTYGARVIINRVLALTPTEFREEEAAAVNPDPAGKYPAGLHTLSTLGDRTLVDGKRSVFAAAEFLRVLGHYLR